MNIRLLVLDVDGTLYDYREKKIHPSTVEALHGAKGRGIQIAVASARSFAELNTLCQMGLGADYFIGASGHSIVDAHRKAVYTRRFTREQTERIISLALAHDAGLTLKYDFVNCLYAHPQVMERIYSNIGGGVAPTLYCETHDYHLKELPIGFTLWGEGGIRDQMEKELAVYPQDYRLELFKNGTVADVFHPGVSKLTALQLLCARLNIATDEVMAFGDSVNDLDMIGWAGMGVAMGNAREEVKREADYVCEPGWEDGIAKTIHKMIL